MLRGIYASRVKEGLIKKQSFFYTNGPRTLFMANEGSVSQSFHYVNRCVDINEINIFPNTQYIYMYLIFLEITVSLNLVFQFKVHIYRGESNGLSSWFWRYLKGQ